MNYQQQVNVTHPTRTSRTNKMTAEENEKLTQCLIAVAEDRDKQAFSHLFSWFAPKIKGLAVKQYRNDNLTMEIVQETMTQVWRKAHLYNPSKGAVSTWIYTIMRNTAFDLMRKVKATPETLVGDDIWPLYEAADEQSFDDHLLDKRLFKYVDNLPEKQQQVIRGVYFHEMSQEQLAKHLNIPLGTVKSRLRLAIAKLKQQMGEQDD